MTSPVLHLQDEWPVLKTGDQEVGSLGPKNYGFSPKGSRCMDWHNWRKHGLGLSIIVLRGGLDLLAGVSSLLRGGVCTT